LDQLIDSMESHMNAKRLAAAAAGLSLLWGAAAVAQDRAPAPARSGLEAQVPPSSGATANDLLILEVVPGQGQPTADEMLMMQMLLLQLLMQAEPPGGQTPNIVPDATTGVAI
jgi:hypothetical protein